MTITRPALRSWPLLGFMAVLLSALAVSVARWTTASVRSGFHGNVAVGVPALIFLSAALVLTVGCAAPLLRPAVTTTGSGLTIAANPIARAVGVVAGLSLVAALVLAGLLKALGRLHVAHESYWITALPVIGLVCAAAFGWLLTKLPAIRRAQPFRVTLTPEGVRGANHGLSGTLGWDDIAGAGEVNAIVLALPIGLSHLVIHTKDGTTLPVYHSQFLGGPALTEAVDLYWRNPSRRGELTGAV